MGCDSKQHQNVKQQTMSTFFDPRILNDYFNKKLEADTSDITDVSNSTKLSDCQYIQADFVADKFSSRSLINF